MKKLLLICAVAALATSCKKEYSCVCTTVDTTNGVTQTTVDTFKAKSNKKDAESWCKAYPKSTVQFAGSSVPVGDMTCELK